MFKSKKAHTCPFYEDHAGEYWQGCWEFNDLCHVSPLIWDTFKDPPRIENSFSSTGECKFNECPVFKELEFESIAYAYFFMSFALKDSWARRNWNWTLKQIINYFNNKSRCAYYE